MQSIRPDLFTGRRFCIHMTPTSRLIMYSATTPLVGQVHHNSLPVAVYLSMEVLLTYGPKVKLRLARGHVLHRATKQLEGSFVALRVLQALHFHGISHVDKVASWLRDLSEFNWVGEPCGRRRPARGPGQTSHAARLVHRVEEACVTRWRSWRWEGFHAEACSRPCHDARSLSLRLWAPYPLVQRGLCDVCHPNHATFLIVTGCYQPVPKQYARCPFCNRRVVDWSTKLRNHAQLFEILGRWHNFSE